MIQSKKWAKYLNRQVTKENIQMVSKHMGRCSGSVDLKEMQVKTPIHYHFIPTRMAKTNKPEYLTILSCECSQKHWTTRTHLGWWKSKLETT